MATGPPRNETRTGVENLHRLLRLSPEGGGSSQDWQLLASDPQRLAEFCDLYESGTLNSETEFAMMMLIISSLDDLLQDEAQADRDMGAIVRVERLLQQNFVLHLHTIFYWCLLNKTDSENVFSVTPMLRNIWTDCFKAEYKPWLE